MRLLQHLLVSHWAINLESYWQAGGIPLPSELLAHCAGKESQYENRNWPSGKFLREAREGLELADFSWNEAIPGFRYREVFNLEIDPAVLHAIQADASRSLRQLDAPVDFVEGTPYRRASKARMAPDREALPTLTNRSTQPASLSIADYLNGLPPHGFSKAVSGGSEAAYAYCNECLECGSRAWKYAVSTLRAIELSPQPFYELRHKTSRVYAPESLQMLTRPVRELITSNWLELDLAKAHLAIAAQQWDIPALRDALIDGADIWQDLQKATGQPKSVLKRLVYALVYGATAQRRDSKPARLDIILEKEGGLAAEQAYETRLRFMRIPLIAELKKARSRQRARIERARGIQDHFGRDLELDPGAGMTWRSLLSAQATALELAILLPAFELAKANREAFKIMLYSFDGIHIIAHDKRRLASWANRLKDAVDQEAQRLGIPTFLGIGELPSESKL